VEMLRLCAFLEPDAIPEAIFTAGQAGISAADYDEICAAVCTYSLALRNPEHRTLTVHRLVQQATQETLSPEAQQKEKARAVQAVSAATPDIELQDWPLCDLLLPHWRLCAGYIREEGITTAEAAYLLYQAGRYLRARALYEESESFLTGALTLAERVHGPIHTTTADTLDEIACLYREIDRAGEAEPLHLRALEITETLAGPEHSQTAGKLHNLALFYLEQRAFDQAEPLFLRAIEIRQRDNGMDEILMAASLTQMGGVYRARSAFDKAEAHYRQALEIYERLLAPDHIEIATGGMNLGLLYVTTGQYAEAETLLLRSLRINQQARGKEHPETGTVFWNLAWLRWKEQRLPEAETYFQQALGIYRKHFGPEHSRVIRLANHYADFRKARGA